MAKKRKEYDDDDGRVIAPMNVDGMPWYVPHKPEQQEGGGEQPELDRGEKWAFFKGVMLAVLLISAVFILAFTVLILVLLFAMRLKG